MAKATREEVRPENPERNQEKYWVPKLQEWVSLNEMLYERVRSNVRISDEEES